MRKNMVRLSNFEHSLLKKAQNLVIKKGTNKIKCKCGWTPDIDDLSLGNITYIGIQCLNHYLQCHKSD